MGARQSRPRLGLALVAAFALAYAVIAASIALDRASADRPELADWVPDPFRQVVLAKIAREQIAAARSAQALIIAETLLRRDPLSPQSTGLLGTARLVAGNATGATSAYRTSAKLGWRDAATQVFWFDTALRAQDFELAVVRFGAVARQWPNAPAIDHLSARLESDPRGLAMLARQAASGANWVSAYATPRAYQPLERLAGRATVLVAAGALGNKLGCNAIAPLVGTLVDRRPTLAGELWASQCSRAAPAGQLADGGFEAQPTTGQLTAFDWQFPGDGALEATVVKQGQAGQALRLRSTAAGLVPVAMQRLVLPSGRYQVSWQESGTGPSRIAASLSCKAERSEADPRDGTGTGPGRVAVIASNGACPAPLLQLWVRPGAREVTIDNVALTPA